jgi:hypothetical protein
VARGAAAQPAVAGRLANIVSSSYCSRHIERHRPSRGE